MPNDLTAKRNLLNSRDDVRSESQRQKLTSSSFTASIWTISGVVLVACGNIEDFLGIDDGGGGGGGRSVHVQSSAVQGARIYFDTDGGGVGPAERTAQDALYPEGFITDATGEARGIPAEFYGKPFVAVLDGAINTETGESLSGTLRSIPDANGDHTLASPITEYIESQTGQTETPEEVVAELLGLDPATLTPDQEQMRDTQLQAILNPANYLGGDERIEALSVFLAEEKSAPRDDAGEFLVGDDDTNPQTRETLFVADTNIDKTIGADAVAGTNIATIHAVSHGNNPVEYSIVDMNDAPITGGDFIVDSRTGVVSVATGATLTASNTAIPVYVLVSNGDSEQTVTIDVTINEPAVELTATSGTAGTIAENVLGSAADPVLTGIEASGAVQESDFTISDALGVASGAGYAGMFDIVAAGNTWNLVLIDNAELDFETIPNGVINLRVHVEQTGNAPSNILEIAVTVTDDPDDIAFSGVVRGEVTKDSDAYEVSGAITIANQPSGTTVDASDGTYGTLTFTSGTWTYTLTNTDATVQRLLEGQLLIDTATLTVGSVTQNISIIINGANEDVRFEDGNGARVSTADVPTDIEIGTTTALDGSFALGNIFTGLGISLEGQLATSSDPTVEFADSVSANLRGMFSLSASGDLEFTGTNAEALVLGVSTISLDLLVSAPEDTTEQIPLNLQVNIVNNDDDGRAEYEITGDVEANQTLTVSRVQGTEEDPDGVVGAVVFQWFRGDEGTPTLLSTGSTYRVTQADINSGDSIGVFVRYTDGSGTTYTNTDGDDTTTIVVFASPVKFATPTEAELMAPENDANWTLTVTATSEDSDSDGSDSDIASYDILEVLDASGADVTSNGIFSITDAGVISISAALDYEMSASYTLRIRATDTPEAESVVPGDTADTGTTTLTVNVQDVNEHAPAFVTNAEDSTLTDGTEEIAEDVANGHRVGLVRATDADGTNNVVTYTLNDGGAGVFGIRAVTGTDDWEIYVLDNTNLDFDGSTKSYTLTITATDSDTNNPMITTETVTITVTDANDNVPEVTPPQSGVFRVRTTGTDDASGNAAAGTGYRITIDDADTNNDFTFNVSDPRFDFQAQGSADVTWELMLLAGQAVTEEEGDTITLTYHVNDGVANSVNVGQTTVTINVVDTPVEFAPITDSTALMADENDADWTLTVTATSLGSNSDGSDSDIVSYEIVEVLDENDMVVASDGVFTIADRTIGEISISAGLDYETSASYTLVIQATDMAESAVPGDTADTNTARFTINVQDLNEHDPVIGPLQLAQGVMGGTPTLAGATTGDDSALTGTADAEYIYGDAGADTITGGGGADHIIGGAGTDGITLSSDANNVETIYYRFSSAGRFPAEIDGTDTINGFRRGEDRLVLIDTDSESTLDLNTLLSDAQNAALNPATFAVNPLFDVAITEATVNLIGVEIQFDEASIIIKYDSGSYVTVRSGGSWQTAGDDYLGVLSSGVPSELGTSGGLLDNNLLPNYFGDTGNTNLQITGDDITANLGIDVLISESRTNADGVFATVSATDDDGTSEISYDITGGTGETLFALDANGGISMVSGATLDYESTTSYTLIISATDGLDTSDARDTSADDTTTITIQLTDVNDNAPMVTADAGTIRTTTGNAADTPTGYSITVTDADTVGTLMVDSDDERFRFERDGTTDTWNLILLANQAVTAGTISLGYSATDGDNPPATGTITLMAVDTPVKFTAPAAADLIITENDSTNAWTVTITATSTGSDSDGSDSAISGYEILEVLDADGMIVDMNGVFSITDAGVISVSGALDHETSAYYTLRIEATDTVESGVSGDTADTGTTDLRVNVGDVNEADPVIEGSPTADAFVTTGATGGTEVTTVVVTDADTSQTFTYAITSGNTGDAFAIDANGVITVASGTTLDRATTATYDLVVTVTDNGVDASGTAATKSDTQNIKVTVREEPPTPIAEQVQGASVQSGTDAADVIDRGDQTGFEVIQGGDLSDTITVGSGGSVVFGGYGSDAITLGDGVDTVVHRFASVKGIWRNDDGADVIRDFELGKDKFILVDTDDNPIDLTTFLDETISGSHSILGPDDMQPIAERGAAGVLIRALPDLDADDLTYIGVAITISTPVKQDGPGGEDPNTAAIEIQIYWDESFVIDPNGTPDADNYERFLGIVDLVGFTGGQLNLENDFTDYSILPTYLNDDDTTRGFDVISLDDLGVEII